MEREDILPYDGGYVDIGIPHYVIPNRLFYQKGILEEILQDEIKLKMENGIKIIPFEEIKEIRLLEDSL
jgi:hypothetical protein